MQFRGLGKRLTTRLTSGLGVGALAMESCIVCYIKKALKMVLLVRATTATCGNRHHNLDIHHRGNQTRSFLFFSAGTGF